MKKIISVILVLVVLCFSIGIEASADCNCNCCCCCEKNKTVKETKTATRILNACQEVTKTFMNREDAHYNVDEDLIWENIAKSYEADGICSTTYVSLVLYVSGLFTEEIINTYNYNWSGEGGLSSMLRDAGWIQLDPEQAQPGDILINQGVHSMIYAGDNSYWDHSSCVGPNATGEPIAKGDISSYCVYRAPRE